MVSWMNKKQKAKLDEEKIHNWDHQVKWGQGQCFDAMVGASLMTEE